MTATTLRPEVRPTAADPPNARSAPPRVALQRRAPTTIRRHSIRAASRVLALVASDLAAFVMLRVCLGALRDNALLGSRIAEFTSLLVPPGQLGGWKFAVALFVGLAVVGAYGPGDNRLDVRRIVVGVGLASALTLWDSLWTRAVGPLLLHYAATVAAASLALVGMRAGLDRLFAKLTTRIRAAERIIIVGDPAGADVQIVRNKLLRSVQMQLVGWVLNGRGENGRGSVPYDDILGSADDIWHILQDVQADTVVLWGPIDDELFDLVVEASAAAGCRLLAVSRYEGVGDMRPALVRYHRLPLVELTLPAMRGRQLLVKRMMDVSAAFFGLLLLAPAAVLVAVAIKLDSRGSVFFAQERVGLGGHVFRLLKFRTMHDGADSMKEDVAHLNSSGDHRLFKIPNDPRVTRVGLWLRRWSIDELPQLWNVLVGDMSLVGPRPFFESDLADYSEHHFVRLGAKPGITGLWQVSGRSSVVDFEEVVRLDREYIDRWSLWLDFKILASTVPVVVRRTGAY